MPSQLPLILTGAPITTTADPNGTAPGSLTTWVTPPHAQAGDDSSAIELELVDGTSATVMLWVWVQGTEWAQLGNAVLSAPHVVSAPVGAFGGGATIYAQVTAVSGSPTTIRAGFTRPLPGTAAGSGQVVSGTVTAQTQGQYNASPATRSNAQVSTLEQDVSGSLRIVEQQAPGYEDNTANRALVEARNNYLNIAGTSAGTVVKSGAGFLHAICINKPVVSAVITIYDNTAASGTKIGTITLPGTLTSDVDELIYDVTFATGLTISVATGATDITVSYR